MRCSRCDAKVASLAATDPDLCPDCAVTPRPPPVVGDWRTDDPAPRYYPRHKHTRRSK